jgi:hypothetical protein
MTPGPNEILLIPTSEKLVKISTLNSGNTFGAVYWTDGTREARMLPDEPWLRMHPENRELFWTDECKKVAEEEVFEPNPKYSEVPFAESPTLEDYRRALSTLTPLTLEKERYLRMRFWWAANDPVRRGTSATPTPPDYRENLQRFIGLLDLNYGGNRLMAAEVARQMADFTKVAEFLNCEFPTELTSAVERIRNLIRQKDTLVRCLNPEDENAD